MNRINPKIGNTSKAKVKNRTSAIKNNVPGNPKNTNKFIIENKNNLGHIKFIPDNSVVNLVLNLLEIESTNRKELVDISAWLISIANPEYHNIELPLITHKTNQCISATVAKAITFFISIW